MKKKFTNYIPKSKKEKRLSEAFTSLKTTQDTLNFLRDLLTPVEIRDFARRLKTARLLEKTDMSYLEIAKKMGTSTTTVTRVALWLEKGCGGYKKVLRKMKK